MCTPTHLRTLCPLLLPGMEFLQQVTPLALHCLPKGCLDCAGHSKRVCGGRGCVCGSAERVLSMPSNKLLVLSSQYYIQLHIMCSVCGAISLCHT